MDVNHVLTSEVCILLNEEKVLVEVPVAADAVPVTVPAVAVADTLCEAALAANADGGQKFTV
jgi:hypothetical protein